MGTRNITSVIMNGKQMVCQYGQWDGYPSWSGRKILEFLRDADMEQFKHALANTTIKVTDYQNAVSYTGSTKDYSGLTEAVYEAKRALSDRDGKWPNTYDVYQYMLEQGLHTEDDLENYFVWTRDTGCDVLPLIYHRPLEKQPYELAAMSDEYQGEYSWDIQGVYVVNLDTSSVDMTFNGYSCVFDMNNLPEDIETTMLVYEKAAYKLYEYKNHDFTAFNQERNRKADPIRNLASDIAVQIGTEIKEEYPELLPDGNATYATDFAQTFIYKQLQKQAEKQMNALAAKITAADQKKAEAAVSVPKKQAEL